MADQILNYSTIEGFMKEVEALNLKINEALTLANNIGNEFANETSDGIYFGQALDEIQAYVLKMCNDISELLGYMELVKAYMILVEESVKNEDQALAEKFDSLENVEVQG